MASVFKEADFLVNAYLMSMDNVLANMIDELEIPEDEMIELLGTYLPRFTLVPAASASHLSTTLLAIRFTQRSNLSVGWIIARRVLHNINRAG